MFKAKNGFHLQRNKILQGFFRISQRTTVGSKYCKLSHPKRKRHPVELQDTKIWNFGLNYPYLEGQRKFLSQLKWWLASCCLPDSCAQNWKEAFRDKLLQTREVSDKKKFSLIVRRTKGTAGAIGCLLHPSLNYPSVCLFAAKRLSVPLFLMAYQRTVSETDEPVLNL